MMLFAILPGGTIADQRAATTTVSRVADLSLSDLDLSTAEDMRLATNPPHSRPSARAWTAWWQTPFETSTRSNGPDALAAARNARTARRSAHLTRGQSMGFGLSGLSVSQPEVSTDNHGALSAVTQSVN